jgi:hypothetical protein
VRTTQCLGLALGALLVAPLAAGSAVAAPPTTTVYRSATAFTVEPFSGVIGPAANAVPAAEARSHGARSIPRSGPAAVATPALAPAAPALLGPGRLLANFDAVGSLDSAITNFGAQFEPPDPSVCVGNGFVVEMVNSAYSVFRPNGTLVAGPFNINGPFDEGLTEFTSDPRCYFDPATDTWFATILFLNRDFTSGHLDVAVNTSGDPTTPWTNYPIDTDSLGSRTGPRHAGCPCFGDQPLLGIDRRNLYVSTNEFSINGPEFNGAQIYAIAKQDLVAERTAHVVHWDGLDILGAPAVSVQPALTYGRARAEFFLNSLDTAGTFDQRIGVWALSHGRVVAGGGIPTLSSTIVASEQYSNPPRAQQKGSTSLLDSGDDRMQQTQFISGEIWGALGTAVSVGGDPQPHAGAAWFRVRPRLRQGVIADPTIVQQGYVSAPGLDLIYPAIAAGPGGRAAMAFTVTGTTLFPSAGYAVLPAGASSFGPVRVAAEGTGSYDKNAGRWGDYSWAVLDPSESAVWMASEYIPPQRSQTLDGRRNWGTRVYAVPVG